MSLSDTLNREMWKGVSTGQFIGMILGIAVALIVMCFLGSTIIGWLLAALLGFGIAHLFHTTFKQKAVYGVVACVLVILVGSVGVSPEVLSATKDAGVSDSPYFSDVEISYDESTGLTVTATVDLGEKTDLVSVIAYTNVTMLVYGGTYTDVTITNMSPTEFTGTYTNTDWDTKTLHYMVLALATENADGSYTIDKSTVSAFLDAKVYDGDPAGLIWGGSAYATAFFGAIFFFILFVSWFFRSRMKKARKKMEDQGRLYPQGYGRCKKCGTIILPGEVECRKCGEPADVPDEIKPKKVEYIRCSNCGAEVPADAESCPKCGAVFDGEETDILHEDGTLEQVIECPECGAPVPEGRDGVRICPRCGKRFQD